MFPFATLGQVPIERVTVQGAPVQTGDEAESTRLYRGAGRRTRHFLFRRRAGCALATEDPPGRPDQHDRTRSRGARRRAMGGLLGQPTVLVSVTGIL
jgi:hypothetical protein